MKETIMNYNSNGEFHGYIQYYYQGYDNDKKLLLYRGNFKNNLYIGYVERYSARHTLFNIR